MSEVPEFLTIDEAARVMGVSRNTAYKEAQRFRATNGTEGLEFVDAAGQMRVPRRRLEKKLRITIDHIPPPRARKAQRAPQSQRGTSAPAPSPAGSVLPDVAPVGTERASKSPVGYVGRVIAQWRVKR